MPDIALWNKCDNKCVMCTNKTQFSRRPSSSYSLRSRMEKFGKNLLHDNVTGQNHAVINGGEPTLHPRFLEFVAWLGKRLKGRPLTLLSNGRSFRNENFAGEFSKTARLPFSVAVPVHSSSPAVHDRITGVKNSFAETEKGLENLFAFFKGEIEIRIVLHKLNAKTLQRTLAWLARKFGRFPRWHATIIHFEIEGRAEKNLKKLSLKLSDAAKLLKKSDKELKRIKEFRLYHYPLCVLSEKLGKYAWISLPKTERLYTEKCLPCSARKSCPGLMKAYYAVYGDKELNPF